MIKRPMFWICLLVAASSSLVMAYDRSEFLFLDEIEIGMTGVGKTIIAGDLIEEFQAEVLGIIDQPGTLSDFIVVRVSGDVIGRAGGIAQGMSGSPVYVDGKLIGALSRAANWSKAVTPIGLVTPIEPMLAVLDDAREDAVLATPSENAILKDIAVLKFESEPDEQLVAALPDVIFSVPVAAPLVAVGLSGRSLDILMSGADDRGFSQLLVTDVLGGGFAPDVRGLSSLGLSLVPLAGSSTGAESDPATLVAGGSVGVALASGDISLGSLGTITYRDEDTLVGYGHSFIDNGSSQFALMSVSIIDTMKSLEASFKLGTLGNPLGTILEDRTAAIGGRLGPVADQIELAMSVRDADRNEERTYSVNLVDEPRLMPELLLSTGFEAIDTTLDRVGQGTVAVTYQILGDNMTFSLDRKDVFFSSTDVAVYAPWQLASLVAYLQYNAFEDPEITQITASMEITQEIRGIEITDLVLDRSYYAPGDTIYYEMALQTFQGDSIVEHGALRIPEDLVSDVVVVRAYGGPRYLEDGESPQVFAGLDDVVEALESLPSYETLTVELFAVDLYGADSSALFGVTEETFDYPGFAVYNELEISVPLLLDGDTSSTSTTVPSGPGW